MWVWFTIAIPIVIAMFLCRALELWGTQQVPEAEENKSALCKYRAEEGGRMDIPNDKTEVPPEVTEVVLNIIKGWGLKLGEPTKGGLGCRGDKYLVLAQWARTTGSLTVVETRTTPEGENRWFLAELEVLIEGGGTCRHTVDGPSPTVVLSGLAMMAHSVSAELSAMAVWITNGITGKQ